VKHRPRGRARPRVDAVEHEHVEMNIEQEIVMRP
jgi:hypothetical protein